MTKISYLCTGNDGVKDEVITLQEAKDFVKEHGGTYEIQYHSRASEFTGFSRVGHRAGGKQKGTR